MASKMLMIGEKESFLMRVLLGKVSGLRVDCGYVPYKVNEINEKWAWGSLIIW